MPLAILPKRDQQLLPVPLPDRSRFSRLLSNSLRLHPRACSRNSARKLACMYLFTTQSIILCMTLNRSSPKWIVAWYSRQRKKRKGYGDTSSDPMMSPEEIANFKTESRESMLATSTDIGILNAKKRELGLPPTKRRRGRPPNRKVKTEQHDGENSFVSNQPCPLAPLLLATDPRPPVSENNLCSSRFMRPIAPRMYLSPSFQLCQPSVPLPTAPNLHDSSNPFVITGPLNNDYIPGLKLVTETLVNYFLTGSLLLLYQPHMTKLKVKIICKIPSEVHFIKPFMQVPKMKTLLFVALNAQ